MSSPGWIGIRSFPLPASSSLRSSKANADTIKKFFKRFKICKPCKGKGFTINEDNIETAKICTIKWDVAKALRILKKRDDIIIAEKIKDIFLHEYHGKRMCKKCNGFGFAKRD